MGRSVVLLVFFFSSFFSYGQQSSVVEPEVGDSWSDLVVNLEEVDQITEWWNIFNDPLLTSLVQQTIKSNYNVQSGLQRLEQSRIMYQQSRSYLMPSLEYSLSYATSNLNQPVNGLNGYGTSVRFNWEVDVFGRIKAQTEASKYNIDVASEDQRYLLLSILSEVTQSYVRMRMFQNQIIVSEENIEVQKDLVRLTQSEFESGLKSKVDFLQAETILNTTMASIKAIESKVANEINLIKVLMGKMPESIYQGLVQKQSLPALPENIQTLVPREALRNRPDVKRVENQILSLMATTKSAKKDLLPKLTLSGNIGFNSESADQWFEQSAMNYFVGPTLTWNLFQGKRAKNEVKLQQSKVDQFELNYKNTLLTAVKEVENNLVNIQKLEESNEWLERGVKSSKGALKLSIDQYSQGLIDYQPLLSSQQTLLKNQNSLIVSQGSLLIEIVLLYQSLGGDKSE
ncbi:efflux transporter outer membrane subunit [Halosquirtibacter xylanolyticus]|uniref:efflux transporter outer membrane subunit n=1 Tax=Halosquirtibacter xylanolyticus TaxID=3374599 RepID=UPI00374A70B8|nr:efflux transporter outer membrane subunit [Prolixibacteraceae bacterium]